MKSLHYLGNRRLRAESSGLRLEVEQGQCDEQRISRLPQRRRGQRKTGGWKHASTGSRLPSRPWAFVVVVVIQSALFALGVSPHLCLVSLGEFLSGLVPPQRSGLLKLRVPAIPGREAAGEEATKEGAAGFCRVHEMVEEAFEVDASAAAAVHSDRRRGTTTLPRRRPAQPGRLWLALAIDEHPAAVETNEQTREGGSIETRDKDAGPPTANGCLACPCSWRRVGSGARRRGSADYAGRRRRAFRPVATSIEMRKK